MKTLNVILSNKPTAQWLEWINALVHAGFEVQLIEPMGTGTRSFDLVIGDAVVLDGMLPHLSRFMGYLASLIPGLPMVVATESDSFAIKYETMQANASSYVSGPLSADRFVGIINQVVVDGPMVTA